MKRWFYALPLLMFGCTAVDQAKEEVVNAPPEFFDQVKGAIMWLLETLFDVVYSWFIGVLGS